MREFSTQINEAIGNGLRPNVTRGESLFFEDLYNLVPYELALRSFENIQDVFPEMDRKTMYPFPQWFKFEAENIAMSDSSVLTINDEYMPFELSKPHTSVWDLKKFNERFYSVDYGDAWMLLNNDGCVYKFQGKIHGTSKLKANALVKHKNRTIIGGAQDGFWTKVWRDTLVSYSRRANIDLGQYSIPLSKRSIVWSGFDSLELPFALFHPSDLNVDEMFISNEFGFMEMPFAGDVLDMFSSNDQLFVFQSDGVTSLAISPQATGATFAETGRQPIGLKQRGAVGGDENSFVFIDNFNQLWKVDSQGLLKLDFRDYMKQLGDDIYITKDPDEEIFYIGDINRAFLLLGNKLTRVYQTVSQAVGGYDFRAGVAYETGDTKASFKTDNLDIGIPSLKTLTGVFISTSSYAKGKVSAESEVKGSKVKRKPVALNKEGYAACRLFGKNHSVIVTFDSFKDLSIDRIELKWQIDDNRQTRGVFTTENASRTGQ